MDFPPEFPLDNLDITIWVQALLHVYLEESSRGASSRDRMKELRVVEMRHFKKRSSSEHEYIVAKILVDAERPYYYLKFDRNVKYPPLKPNTDSGKYAPSISATGGSLSTADGPSFASIYRLVAVDMVAPLDNWPSLQDSATGIVHLVDKIRFTSNHPTLLELAIVAELTHEHSKEYQLLRRQCFWYANVISQVLQKIATSAKVEHINDSAGTWKRLRIVRAFPNQTNTIYDLYQNKMFMLSRKISDAERSWQDLIHDALDAAGQHCYETKALPKEEGALKEMGTTWERDENA